MKMPCLNYEDLLTKIIIVLFLALFIALLYVLIVSDVKTNTLVALLTAGFTGLLALATFVLALQTKRNTDLTHKSIKLADANLNLARQEFITSHRPKIRVKHLWMTAATHAGDTLKVKLIVVNNGSTAATIINIRIGFYVSHGLTAVPDGFLDGKERIKRNDRVEPGITIVYKDQTDNMVLKEDQVIALGKHERTLYCVGDIEYIDDIGAVRKTAYCRVWNNN